ncbi:MAG TPA: glycosyltransferase family 39 protein [Candidatus Peribacteraceae bacterium]|nr:glycosyltransferase family 39 protein [Candidatus Peribacteraceae bacterium]
MRLTRPDIALLGLILLFLAAWILAVFVWDLPGLAAIHAQGLQGDAVQYNAGAVSLLQHHMFSLDGVHPFYEREIGYSVFIAAIYSVAGIDNYLAVFIAQTVFFLITVVIFEKQVRRVFSPAVSFVTSVLLLALPSVLLIQLQLFRESLTLSLMLLFASAFLRLTNRPSMRMVIAAGVCIGLGMLVYAPLLLLPPFLLVFTKWLKVPLKHLAILMLTAYVVLSPWLIRNMIEVGKPCPTGCYRNALQWYVRGERSQYIRGLEPYRCLWSEYVSRNWTGRSPYCSFNAVWHREWPNGFIGVPQDAVVAREGQRKILAYFPYYLWDSVSEVVEFHLPFVGPWGRIYNVSAAAALFFVYVGCLLALPVLLCTKHRFFLLLAVYFVALFALTDATPRYHMPVIFCYALLGAVGYHRLLTRFRLCPP